MLQWVSLQLVNEELSFCYTLNVSGVLHCCHKLTIGIWPCCTNMTGWEKSPAEKLLQAFFFPFFLKKSPRSVTRQTWQIISLWMVLDMSFVIFCLCKNHGSFPLWEKSLIPSVSSFPVIWTRRFLIRLFCLMAGEQTPDYVNKSTVKMSAAIFHISIYSGHLCAHSEADLSWKAWDLSFVSVTATWLEF